MTIPHRGTLLRSQAELTVHFVRLIRPMVRWLNRQRWVSAYAEWDELHVPAWFTPMNVLYVGFGLYVGLVVWALMTGRA